MRFQSAMDSQRHKLEILESKDKLFTPPLKTPLMLEKHAASIYTLAAFYDFQAEIGAACLNMGWTHIILIMVKSLFFSDLFA